MSSLTILALALLVVAAGGVAAHAAIVTCVWLHRRSRAPAPRSFPGISILKPLCGVDDDLEANLASFAQLKYEGPWEVVLGVRDTSDPAWRVAQETVRRWPERFRLQVQESSPGLNPKVNQLVTLEQRSRYEVLVVSDSNVRIHPDYLTEIAGCITQEDVGCVTHPIIGLGEESFGSLMDNTYLTSGVAAGQISAMVAAGQPVVVGKSMAFWREDLAALGGFLSVKDYLAEDYVFGRLVRTQLKKRVLVGHTPVPGYSRRKSLADFAYRYRRWGVIHRTSVTLVTSLGHGVLQPAFWALLAVACLPQKETVLAWGAAVGVKALADLAYLKMLRPTPFSLRLVAALVAKDLLMQAFWVNGFFERTVEWRGNRLRVGLNSRLLGEAPTEEQPAVPSAEA